MTDAEDSMTLKRIKAAMKGLLPIEDLSVDEKTILDDMEQHPLGLDG
ncbi:hypothetical protein [Xanthomonas arboricola]|nr:hypothetical protein [Xanthomonas arboricola]